MKFFVLASKTVELTGYVEAKNMAEAKEIVRKEWYLYDEHDNCVSAGVADEKQETPKIAEGNDHIKVVYIEDKDGFKHRHGNFNKLVKQGKWKKIAL